MANMDLKQLKENIFQRLGPRGIEELIPELDPTPAGHNRYMKAICPKCKKKEAYLYLPPSLPYIRCNRENKCGHVVSLIDYIMERDNKGFWDVIHELAERAGVEISQENRKRWEQEKTYEDALEEIHKFFMDALYREEGKETLNYLHERGYTDEDIEAMGLGYFPGEGKTLVYIERGLKADQEVKERIKKGPLKYARIGHINGQNINTYKVVFPYRGLHGEIKTFIGRPITPISDGQAKYPPFGEFSGVSNEHPFGLYNVRGEEIILVEGYLDALLAKARGLENVVALTRNQLSQTQLEVIAKRGIKRVILALDNDEGGLKGTADAIKKLLDHSNITVFVAPFSGAKDPDELIRKSEKGIEAFKEAIENGKTSWRGIKWLTDYYSRTHQLDTDIGRDTFHKELTELGKQIRNPLDIEDLKDSMATALRIDREDISQYLETQRARELREKARQSLQETMRQATSTIKDPSTPIEECLGILEEATNKARSYMSAEQARLAFKPFIETSFLEALAQEKEGLSIGYEKLDEIASFPLGAVTLIAGRPGHGKTTFLINLLRRQIEINPKKRYVFATYEESERRIILKLLISMCQKPLGQGKDRLNTYKKILLGEPVDESRDSIDTVKETWAYLKELLAEQRVIIQHRPGNVRELSQAITGLRDRYGDELGAVFVDYMQIIPTPEDMKKVSASYQRVQGISAIIRDMAVETNLPIIAGAQLNRQATNKTNDKPSLHTILRPEFLREAGDLEQDANLIFAIYNHLAGQQEQDSLGKNDEGLSVVTLKNREGPITGNEIKLTYRPSLWRIDD